jgi:8-oxo-dGTP pyrophosphatase MutT (NUDIX family)/RimJ/RimL family protein N-acetyltransferase
VILRTGDLVVRDARPGDLELVATWLGESVRSEAVTDWSVHAIAEREGVPVGAASWTTSYTTDATIRIVVGSKARGRGVGAALAAAISAELFATGVTRLVAKPDVHDDHMIRSFERAGFRATHTDEGTLVMERRAHEIEPWLWRPGGAQILPRIPNATPGDDPPWPAATATDTVDLGELVRRVRARGPGATSAFHVDDPRYSAVLIALFEGERGAEVVLTRRSWVLSSHRGEVSFPGGRTDPGEHPHRTAVREAEEEIGLHPDDVEIVGELDQIATVVSRSVIVPVVARLGARPDVRAMTAEVDRILTVPLVEFMMPRTYRSERWGLDWERVVHFFELDDETVWGATGRMLFQLLAIASVVREHPTSSRQT